ncbi:HAP5 [[Candida] subhashii]|uniref:HAP5 n=1 Tax=[Candida] subhashii TaxID=561895 RepID=A0A8J5UPZ4_9ASCO|nr:HAP5 [[Candida] subhashii]KAG7664381.1 HAP5 [[Candida] subhashii]
MQGYDDNTYGDSEELTHYQQQPQQQMDEQPEEEEEQQQQLGHPIVDEAELLAAQAAAEEAAAQQQQQQVDAFNNVAQGLTGKYRDMMMQYWQETINSIEHDEHDFKNHQLPLARIKKVMKTDEDVRMISAEAPILFAKGCDVFITELTMRAWIHAEENKRRTLQKSDIAAALTKSDMFDFLIDIVPREEEKPKRAYGQSRSASYVNQPTSTIVGPSSSQGPPPVPGQHIPQEQQSQSQQPGPHDDTTIHEQPEDVLKPEGSKSDILQQQLLHEQMLQQQLMDQQQQPHQPQQEMQQQQLPPPPTQEHSQQQHQSSQQGIQEGGSIHNSIPHQENRENSYSNYNGYQGTF